MNISAVRTGVIGGSNPSVLISDSVLTRADLRSIDGRKSVLIDRYSALSVTHSRSVPRGTDAQPALPVTMLRNRLHSPLPPLYVEPRVSTEVRSDGVVRAWRMSPI
jgi:hypothetical protein